MLLDEKVNTTHVSVKAGGRGKPLTWSCPKFKIHPEAPLKLADMMYVCLFNPHTNRNVYGLRGPCMPEVFLDKQRFIRPPSAAMQHLSQASSFPQPPVLMHRHEWYPSCHPTPCKTAEKHVSQNVELFFQNTAE